MNSTKVLYFTRIPLIAFLSRCSFLGLLILHAASCASTVQPIRTNCLPSAHRGIRSLGPDNSLTAITAAISHQIPFIEIDVRKTVGGQAIFHERTIKADHCAAPPFLIGREVASLSEGELAQVKHLDGSPILSLRDLLVLAAASHSVVQLDVKPDSPEHIEEVATAILEIDGALAHTTIQCQHVECVKHIRQKFKDVPVLARVFSASELKEVLEFSPAIIQVDTDLLSPKLVDDVHRYGGKILVKTLDPSPDNATSWSEICSKGADVLLTDHPLELLHLTANKPRS